MKKLITLSSILILGLALVVASALSRKASAAGKSRTTQGIVVNQHHDGTLAVVDTQVTKLQGKWCCCAGTNGPECTWVDDDSECAPCIP